MRGSEIRVPILEGQYRAAAWTCTLTFCHAELIDLKPDVMSRAAVLFVGTVPLQFPTEVLFLGEKVRLSTTFSCDAGLACYHAHELRVLFWCKALLHERHAESPPPLLPLNVLKISVHKCRKTITANPIKISDQDK